MASDYNMLRKGVASISDFQRLQDEFELKKAEALKAQTGQDPAALRLANEYESAVQSGNIDRANRIAAFAKIYDKNVMQTPEGQYVPLPGLPQALSQLEFGKETGTQQARDIYEPGRAGAVEGAKLRQQLNIEPLITEASKSASLRAESGAELTKKQKQDVSTLRSIEAARAVLPRATSGGMQSLISGGARFAGVSTEQTKADAELEPIAAALVQNVPRFEGPQSNIDVQFYKDAAADVANPRKSVGDRLAALQSIENLINLRRQQGLLNESMQIPQVDLNAPIGQLPPNPGPVMTPNQSRLRYNPQTGEFE